MIISVWGNSGSGKSTLSVKLALELASRGKNTILIDTDYNAPQLGVWYPDRRFDRDRSLASLLSSRVTEETVMAKTNVISGNLGILGYTGDFASSAAPRRTDTAIELFSLLRGLADFVIADCQYSPLNDMLTFEAANSADAVLLSLTPDIKALSWFDATVRMFGDGWESGRAPVIKKLFNKALPVSPVDEIEKVTGTADYCLPFSMEIAGQLCSGKLGDPSCPGGRDYAGVIRTVASDLVRMSAGARG